MLKRIRVGELRVGMFVEDCEEHLAHFAGTKLARSFRINSSHDVSRLSHDPVMSVLINLKKGVDVAGTQPAAQRHPYQRFISKLRAKYSADEIQEARHTITQTLPEICRLMAAARTDRVFHREVAEKTVDQIMGAVATNVEALIYITRLRRHDDWTYLHSLGVSALMIDFGRKLGMDKDRVRLLGIGGLVHDIGKAVIRRGVLQKAGKLTSAEFDHVKQHAEAGYVILSNAGEISIDVLDICRFHHEQFCGEGYPVGLNGEDIPYVARVAAICDVYDALTSVRPYKRALSSTEALGIMTSNHAHFDPALLSDFMSKSAF